MAKRALPLAEYEWDEYLSQAPPSKRARQENSAGSGESIEDETVGIEEDFRELPTQQQQGMAILNTMPVKGAVGRGKPVEEEVPSVYLATHYRSVYNPYMNSRYPRCESDDSSSSEENESGEGSEEVDLFAGLDRTDSSSSGLRARGTAAAAATRESILSEAVEGIRAADKAYSARRTKEKAKEREHYDTQERGECFLCAWGNRFHDGVKAKHVNRLFDIINEYGSCDNLELAQKLHLYYKHNVHKPKQGMTMLTVEIALEHIEGGMHTLSAIIFIGESIKTWKMVFFSAANALFKANGKTDKEMAALMKDSQRMLIDLYKLDPAKLNFNFGKSRDDTVKLGAPMMIMPELKQKREKDKRAKKTKQIQVANKTFKRGLEV